MTILRNYIARASYSVPAALTALVFSVTISSTVAAQTAAVVGLPAPVVSSHSVPQAKPVAQEMALNSAPAPLPVAHNSSASVPVPAAPAASPTAPLPMPFGQDSSSSSGSVSNQPAPQSSGGSDAWLIILIILAVLAVGGVVVYEEEDTTDAVVDTCDGGEYFGDTCTDDADCGYGYDCVSHPVVGGSSK